MNASSITPYKNEQSKKQQVSDMFDHIAPRYDFLNHFLSAGIDKLWRRKSIRRVGLSSAEKVLDIATGTGDLAIEVLRQVKVKELVGVDISQKMMEIGEKKVKDLGLGQIRFQLEDSESLSFSDNSFDLITVAFGVRNFEHLEKGLSEMYRVAKPGSKILILEFSKPEYFPFKQIYQFYFSFILPIIGRMISKDNAAYSYLPESVKGFPYGKKFEYILSSLGFKNIKSQKLTFGIATSYLAEK